MTCDVPTVEYSPPSSPPMITDQYISYPPDYSPEISQASTFSSHFICNSPDPPSEMPSTSSSSRKRKRDKEYVEKVEKKINVLIEIEKRKEAIEERKENLLKDFVEREAEVQKALIAFLKKY